MSRNLLTTQVCMKIFKFMMKAGEKGTRLKLVPSSLYHLYF